MNWKALKEKSWFKFFTNKYVYLSTFFVVWMVFFDSSSLLEHIRLSMNIGKLEKDKEYYQENLVKIKKELYRVKHDPQSVERIARERFFLKRSNEDIFVVVDSAQ